MDIIPTIERFINQRMYHYALMINGGWGSGKTYFVRETLIPYIQKTGHDVNYISLYGLNNTDEISQMLCVQAIKDKMSEKVRKSLESKGGQISTKIATAAFRLGLNYLGASDAGIESVLQAFPNYDNNVIIFDDLERCGCSLNEVLGYINNFVEHSDASVILVANEVEIGKWQLDRNPEIQMLIAMDSRIKVELPPTSEELFGATGVTGGEKKEKTSFAPDEVEYRRKTIFHSNEEYRSIKEKVIGITIDYEPELDLVFKTMIEKNIPVGVLRERLLSEITWLISIAEKEKHKNLRTFQYFLEKISLIFQSIDNQYPTLHQVVIRYTYRSSVRYMKGEKMPEWESDYGNQVFGKERTLYYSQELGFKFIDELITKNTIDVSYVNDVLGHYARIAEKKGQLNNDPYQFISKWWTSEDEQVGEWLDSIEKNIRSGKYSTELYADIIRYTAELRVHHIMEEKCNSIFLSMQDYIKTADPKELDDLDKEGYYVDGETRKLYWSMYEVISKLLNEAKAATEKQEYESALNDPEQWATNLANASANKGNLAGYSFVYWLQPIRILERIKGSNNTELNQFRIALNSVYATRVYYEHMKDDYNHLKAIHDGVRALDTSTWGEVKRAYKDWIVNDISGYLERIKLSENDE